MRPIFQLKRVDVIYYAIMRHELKGLCSNNAAFCLLL